ncbi:MAG: 3-oxoacyl-[acyl-carrier-protein] reductase FabG [Candidatus Anoxychlamydiales bacterium]|nr:3-oxoacyl-[acyl-carrier-protein] reductase FabG [Candidatus Anoxychlamydiales bacterium]NGX36394.1 3-oxoacyl-[acyl-carrier-protein] reductase FabG [Candidatus Anoxychlamydiales bacterium]
MQLKNKKVIVTGASQGIGKAIAQAFVKQGSDVAIFATNPDRLKQALKELEDVKIDQNQKIIAKKVDVSIFDQVETAILELLKEFGHIDILVNNAGITKDNLLLKMSEEDFDRVIAINLKSVYNTCKVLTRPMIKNKKGKIINISSIVGLIGNPGQANYAASKAGIIGFTKSLAKELGSRNICVNAIAPGFIQTPMTKELPENIKEQMLKNIPLKRFGLPQDIANLVLFLSSYMADYITGQTITIDGGMVT